MKVKWKITDLGWITCPFKAWIINLLAVIHRTHSHAGARQTESRGWRQEFTGSFPFVTKCLFLCQLTKQGFSIMRLMRKHLIWLCLFNDVSVEDQDTLEHLHTCSKHYWGQWNRMFILSSIVNTWKTFFAKRNNAQQNKLYLIMTRSFLDWSAWLFKLLISLSHHN